MKYIGSRRRGSMQIMHDVLEEASQAERTGVGVTRLLTISNLPFTRGLSFVDKLVGSGLINRIKTEKRVTFVITGKGRLMLDEYKKFSDLAGTFGLEL